MPRGLPALNSLSVELVNDDEESTTSRAAEPASLVRQRTVANVQRRGGRVAGQRLTKRERCRRHLNSLGWQSGQLLACLADIIMLFAEMNGAPVSATNTVTCFVLLIFIVDLALRGYTFRKMLLRQPMAYFDFSVVFLSVIFFFIGVGHEAELGVESTQDDPQKAGTALRGLLVFLRWLRAIRATMMLVKTGGSGRSTARQLTGENKRRFVDLQNGFDLDLAYIHPRLIAMSVPAVGFASLYRNPLSEVVRFFESRHSKEGVLVVNACPEMPYPWERLQALGGVIAYHVQDHTPPCMTQFVEFVNAAATAWREGKVIAVHCRGGKGRTGSLICAWLLYIRECVDADDALAKFALERTELALGKKKLQGVDTPSQRRYVQQMHQLLQGQGCYFMPSEPARSVVRPPERPPFALRELMLRGFFAAAPKGPLICAIHTEILDGSGGRPGPCYVTTWSAPVMTTADVPPEVVRFKLEDVQVSGDVRISVFSLPELLKVRDARLKKGLSGQLPFDRATTRPWQQAGPGGGLSPSQLAGSDEWIVAGKEPGCLFYFLFHTAYAKLEMSRMSLGEGGAEASASEMRVPVRMMDKAFKTAGKKKSKYRGDGEATLRMSKVVGGVAQTLQAWNTPIDLGMQQSSPLPPAQQGGLLRSGGGGFVAPSASPPTASSDVQSFVTVPLVATQPPPNHAAL